MRRRGSSARLGRALAIASLLIAVTIVACTSNDVVSPARPHFGPRVAMYLSDCSITHFTADCFRALTSGESSQLWQAASAMAATQNYPCQDLGLYILDHLGDAKIIHGTYYNGGYQYTGDAHAGSGNPEGHAHSTDSVDIGGERWGRGFDGSGGMLNTLVHEYAHLGLGVGQGPPDPAAAIASLCLGY